MPLDVDRVVLSALTSDPTSPADGELWFRSDLDAVSTRLAGATALAPKNKPDATASPTTGDDSGDGYSVGSKWFDSTNKVAWVCLDATAAAAVWKPTTRLTVSDSPGGSGNLTTTYTSEASVDPGPAGTYLVEWTCYALRSDGSAGTVEAGVSIDASTTLQTGSYRKFERGGSANTQAQAGLMGTLEVTITAGQTIDLMAREDAADGTIFSDSITATLVGM